MKGASVLRAAVFDLDHTLFDPETLPRELFSGLEPHVRRVAGGDQLSSTVLEAALADARRLPFDKVVARYQLPPAVSAAWREAASALEVTTPLAPYDDVHVVSAGFRSGGFSLQPASDGSKRASFTNWGWPPYF